MTGHPFLWGDIAIPSAPVPNPMQVTTFFACTHSESMSVEYDPNTAPTTVTDGPCSDPACQAKPLADIIGPRASLGVTEDKLISTMKAQLTIAGMTCESNLRKFGMVEPMTLENLLDANVPLDIATTLLCNGPFDRPGAAAVFLRHKAALAMLSQFENCVKFRYSAWQANMLAEEIAIHNTAVQQKLKDISSTVARLTKNSYPAPGGPFKMIEGIESFEQSWGKNELAMLNCTEIGQSVLAFPLTSANILAAKHCIRDVEMQIAFIRSLDPTQFWTLNPGMENSLEIPPGVAGDASAQQHELQLHQQGLSQSSSSSTLFQQQQQQVSAGPDIRSLRPAQRALSSKMAKKKLQVNMAKVDAYSGKPWDQITDPWWNAKEA